MHRSTYCNITSSNIISYIQMLTNPWDSTVPQVRPHYQRCVNSSRFGMYVIFFRTHLGASKRCSLQFEWGKGLFQRKGYGNAA